MADEPPRKRPRAKKQEAKAAPVKRPARPSTHVSASIEAADALAVDQLLSPSRVTPKAAGKSRPINGTVMEGDRATPAKQAALAKPSPPVSAVASMDNKPSAQTAGSRAGTSSSPATGVIGGSATSTSAVPATASSAAKTRKDVVERPHGESSNPSAGTAMSAPAVSAAASSTAACSNPPAGSGGTPAVAGAIASAPAATSRNSAGIAGTASGGAEITPSAPSASKVANPEANTKREGSAFLRLSVECIPSMNVDKLVYLDKDVVTFGRMPTNTVVLDSVRAPQMVSRVHGRLQRVRKEGNLAEWMLHDNKSLNGIYVNGECIGGDGRRLIHGDIIGFGRKMIPPEFEFVFEDPGAHSPPPMAPPAPPEPQPPTAAALEEAFAEHYQEHMQKINELQQELQAEREKKIAESQQRASTRPSLDLADLQSELQCSICQDWVVHASTIECSHTYCWACIDSWLLHKKFECPVCRHSVTREPVRNRALDTIILKTIERCGEEQKDEYQERVDAAEKNLKKMKKLHQDLEKSVDDALKKGKAFFHIDSSWVRREKDTFQRGVKEYTGDTRETYCRLTGLTVQWVHSADDNKLNQALHNLGLQSWVSEPEAEIRKRLLMFLRYG